MFQSKAIRKYCILLLPVFYALSLSFLQSQEIKTLSKDHYFQIDDKKWQPIRIMAKTLDTIWLERRIDTVELTAGRYKLDGLKQKADFEVNKGGQLYGKFINREIEYTIVNSFISKYVIQQGNSELIGIREDSTFTTERWVNDNLTESETFLLFGQDPDKSIRKSFDEDGNLVSVVDEIIGSSKSYWRNGNLKALTIFDPREDKYFDVDGELTMHTYYDADNNQVEIRFTERKGLGKVKIVNKTENGQEYEYIFDMKDKLISKEENNPEVPFMVLPSRRSSVQNKP